MKRHMLKTRRSQRAPIKVYPLSIEQQQFVREFKAKLASMQVIENFYIDNVIEFPGKR